MQRDQFLEGHSMLNHHVTCNDEFLMFCSEAEITFDDARTPQTPIAYTDAQIICRVTGNPNPTVYWRYRGQRLVTGSFHFHF